MLKTPYSIVLRADNGDVIVIKDNDIVGRTEVGKEVLGSYEGMSRQHVQFLLGEGGWFMVDLGSKNGTSLNGEKLTPRKMTPIKAGDTIALAKTFSATVADERRTILPVQDDEDDARQVMTVMFVDLKGSTDYFQQKGTMVASTWINKFYEILTQVVSENQGRHIKNIGDAILAVFTDPVKAARAAISMQKETKAHNEKVHQGDCYYIRIGMNTGKVLYKNNDVFGNSVNIAARIQGIAPPGQTYISLSLSEAIKGSREFRISFINKEELRGVKEKMSIYELAPADSISAGKTTTLVQ